MNQKVLIEPAGCGEFSRRRFVQGGVAVLALSSLDLCSTSSWASVAPRRIPELSGTQFNLEISTLDVNFTGQPSVATVVNGSLPAPSLRVREGDTITLQVTNRLREPTAVHWHGVLVPAGMDGVPGISFPGIAPGETFTYRFKLQQNGTYWYHAHTLHEQTGLYGALIVEPREPEPILADRDYAVILSDWTDENPLQVFLNLKKMGGYYNFGQLTAADFSADVFKHGLAQASAKRRMWNRARESSTIH